MSGEKGRWMIVVGAGGDPEGQTGGRRVRVLSFDGAATDSIGALPPTGLPPPGDYPDFHPRTNVKLMTFFAVWQREALRGDTTRDEEREGRV